MLGEGFSRWIAAFSIFFLLFINISAQEEIQFRTKDIIAKYVHKELVIQAADFKGNVLKDYNTEVTVKGLFVKKKVQSENGDEYFVIEPRDIETKFENGVLQIEAEIRDAPVVITPKGDTKGELAQVSSFPTYYAIIPPLIAIILAIVTKEVLFSLFMGIWAGVFILVGYRPVGSILTVIDTYLINTLCEREYVQVIVFSLSIGGVIGIVRKSGGVHDMVEKIAKWAKSPRSGMVSTWLMGIVIFFDDYANTLLVGNSMRPVTDRLRISREKLAYIVDSTAAPICSLFLISTWIGAELGYIGDGLKLAGQDSNQAFEFFLASLPYHFYSILTVLFVFYIAWSGKDYGAMLEAEKRARETGDVFRKGAVLLTQESSDDVEPPSDKPHRWWNAVVPICVVIFVTIYGIYYTGAENYYAEGGTTPPSILDILKRSDSYTVLVWAGFWGSIIAGIMVVAQRILSLPQTVSSWVGGIKAMMMAMLVLILAWTLKAICVELGTDKFIYYNTKDFLHVKFLPVLSFLIAAAVAFATGTSWGTMGLLFPLVLPLAIELSRQQLGLPVSSDNHIILGTIGSILAGASFGDHCSPISDTTVMSSMASACDHIDHVKTQIPYALTAGGISCLLGYLPIGLGLSVWLALPLGIAAVVITINTLGKNSEAS